MPEPTTQDRFKRGAADAGRYFDFMAQFINFQPEHAEAIRATRFVVEKHIPGIVADFYANLLSVGDAYFDVADGAVLKGPATEPLRVYQVVVDGEVVRVE